MKPQDTAQTSSSAQSEKSKEGWTEVTVGPWTEPEVGESIEGKIVGIEIFKSDEDEEDSYAYKIEEETGSIHFVGQSNALRALDQIHSKWKDVKVEIEFTGKTASGSYEFDIRFLEEEATRRDERLSNIPEGQ